MPLFTEIAFLLILPYFWYGYIRQLLIFSTLNIAFCFVSLVFTVIAYQKKFPSALKTKERDIEVGKENVKDHCVVKYSKRISSEEETESAKDCHNDPSNTR